MSLTKVFLFLAVLSLPTFAFNLPQSKLIERDYGVIEYDNDYTKYEGHGEIILPEISDQEKRKLKDKIKTQFTYSYRFYRPLYNSKDRLVVVTPNIGGLTLLEIRIAHKLAKSGFHVLIPMTELNFENMNESTFKEMDNIQYYSMALTEKLIDKLHNEGEEFDRESIGLVGASLGGIRSTMLMGIDERYRAMFISVAGSDLPSIYAQSQHETVMDIRYRHMKYLQINDEAEYEEMLREHITLDPSIISNSPHLDNVAMIIANDDRVVPAVNQWKLWEQLKDLGFRPKTYEKNCRHIMGALWIIRYEKRVVRWMEQKL